MTDESSKYPGGELADIGDAFAATPALRALRKSFPAARIKVLLSSDSTLV